MHIVITTQCFAPDVGGIENLMSGLATALAARGHQVLVLADRPRGGQADDGGRPFTVRRFGGPGRGAGAARHVTSSACCNTARCCT